MPKFYQRSQEKLSKAQKKLSKKKSSKYKKSNNYLKQLNKVNKIHKKITNQRLDYLHKLSTQIANEYDMVAVEDIDMKNISNSKFHNGKATMNNGYGMFRTMLKYKLEDRGKYYIEVDRFYPSSQLCSRCSFKHKLMLSERIYKCPECNLVIDRDYNAALNIKAEGQRLLKSA
jgi:putative transposase